MLNGKVMKRKREAGNPNSKKKEQTLLREKARHTPEQHGGSKILAAVDGGDHRALPLREPDLKLQPP